MGYRRKREYSDFVNSLPGNLAVVRSESLHNPIIEVVFVHRIRQIKSSFLLEHGTPRYIKSDQEFELKVDATLYHLQENNNVTKTKAEDVLFNVARTEILEVTKDTVAALLIDDNKLIRRAARDWYEERTAKLG